MTKEGSQIFPLKFSLYFSYTCREQTGLPRCPFDNRGLFLVYNRREFGVGECRSGTRVVGVRDRRRRFGTFTYRNLSSLNVFLSLFFKRSFDFSPSFTRDITRISRQCVYMCLHFYVWSREFQHVNYGSDKHRIRRYYVTI